MRMLDNNDDGNIFCKSHNIQKSIGGYVLHVFFKILSIKYELFSVVLLSFWIKQV